MLIQYAALTNGQIKDDKMIKQALGKVINNSADWDGGKKEKMIKKLKRDLELDNQ